MNHPDERQERFARFREEFTRDHAQRWGEIAFCRWNKKYRPVLILSPFAVPPNIRKPWFEKYKQVRRVTAEITCDQRGRCEKIMLYVSLVAGYPPTHSVRSFCR